ncbi:MAG: peptidylprolyl isomerase [Gammaproteobacteria bacterium]|nr:peptidylprolyl isomerase [Gammaproteobacteria bacterium]
MIRFRLNCALAGVLSTALIAGPAGAQSTTASAAESPAQAADAMAMVNGKPVLRGAHNAIVRQLRQNGQQVNEQQILDELINLELLTQKAEDQAIHERADVAALLRLQYIQTLAQTYMGALSEDIAITDDDLKKEYEIQTANMTADEYRASHILLQDESSAAEVIKALDDGGDFAKLAAERSTGPTGPTGGDLGWFQSEAMVPEFSAAVAKMSVGEYSQAPVQSSFGWHVILLADKRGSQKPAFDDIKTDLHNLILRRELTTMIDSMRSEADIKVLE